MNGGVGCGAVMMTSDNECGCGLMTAVTYTCRSGSARALDALAIEGSLLQARVEARL